MCYSVQPGDQIFVKGYGFLSFAENMSKNIGKKVKTWVVNTARNFLIIPNNLPDVLKTISKRAVQKTAEATGDLIGNEFADEIMKISRTSPQNSLETVENEHNKEIPKERYITSVERQKIIDDLKLI